MRIRHLSSWATFDCFIKEMAVTKVSMDEAKSLTAASCTALAIAEEDTVRFLAIISSNSTSLIAAPGGGYPGGTPAGGKNAGLTWAPPGRAGAAVCGGGNRPGTCLIGGGPVRTGGGGGPTE